TASRLDRATNSSTWPRSYPRRATWNLSSGAAPGRRSALPLVSSCACGVVIWLSPAEPISPPAAPAPGSLQSTTTLKGSVLTHSLHRENYVRRYVNVAERLVAGGRGQFLDRHEVEVVSERPRACGRDPAFGPPDRVAAERDHHHPLAVTDPLGRDRVGGLAVQHRDQVGYRGEQPAALERDQVLILLFQPDKPSRVLGQALDDHRAARESAGHVPADVQHLASGQPEGSGRLDHGRHRAARRVRRRLADPDRLRHRAAYRHLAGLRRGQREVSRLP